MGRGRGSGEDLRGDPGTRVTDKLGSDLSQEVEPVNSTNHFRFLLKLSISVL